MLYVSIQKCVVSLASHPRPVADAFHLTDYLRGHFHRSEVLLIASKCSKYMSEDNQNSHYAEKKSSAINQLSETLFHTLDVCTGLAAKY